MSYLSNTNLLVRLPSGHLAVYSVEPQHIPREGIPASQSWPVEYGRQVAHQHGTRWYEAGSWDEITDLRTIALLERCPSPVLS